MIAAKSVLVVVIVALLGSACRSEKNGGDKLTLKQVARELKKSDLSVGDVENILKRANDKSTHCKELLGFSIDDLAAAKWNRDTGLCTYAELAKRKLNCKKFVKPAPGYYLYCLEQLRLMEMNCPNDPGRKPTSYSQDEHAKAIKVIGDLSSERRLTDDEFLYALDLVDLNHVPAIMSRRPKPSRKGSKTQLDKVAQAVLAAMAWHNDTEQCSPDNYESIRDACAILDRRYNGAFEYCKRQLTAMEQLCKDRQSIMDDCLQSVQDGKLLKEFIDNVCALKEYNPASSRESNFNNVERILNKDKEKDKVIWACGLLHGKIDKVRGLFTDKFIEGQLVLKICELVCATHP
jgi:hypothetical protein